MGEVEPIACANFDRLPGQPGEHAAPLIGHPARFGGLGLLGVQPRAQRMTHLRLATHCRSTGRSASGQERRHGSRAPILENRFFSVFIRFLLVI